MNPRAQVLDALRALTIVSPTSFTWLGEPGPTLPVEVTAAMDEETAASYLRHTLQNHLYVNFYTRGAALAARPDRTRPESGQTPFVQSLSAANAGAGSLDAGWTVVREDDDGRIVVTRDGLSLWARPSEVDGSERSPGGVVQIRMPKELLRLSPGFYFALGDAAFGDTEPIVRVYWHLRSEAAPALVALLTTRLNEATLPFRLKVLSDPSTYSRCDAGVLYVMRADFERVAADVATVYDALSAHLRAPTPALTKPLAPGIAVAEEPPSHDSFGLDRCGLLAAAVVRAWQAGATRDEDRLEIVAECFSEAGVSLDAPHLNAGSTDTYALRG